MSRFRVRAAPSRGGPPPEAELEVLACLRERGELDARTVGEILQATRPLTHSSVATLLKRLEAKGLVERRPAPVGKAFLYRASRRSGAAVDSALRRLVGRVFGGDRLTVVSTLYESASVSDDELAALRRLVDELHGRGRGKER